MRQDATRDPYAGLPPEVAQRLREMDREESGRTLVRGTQADAQRDSEAARNRVDAQSAAFPGFAIEADAEVRRQATPASTRNTRAPQGR